MRCLPLDKVIEAIRPRNDSSKSRYQLDKELRARISAIKPIEMDMEKTSPKPRETKCAEQ